MAINFLVKKKKKNSFWYCFLSAFCHLHVINLGSIVYAITYILHLLTSPLYLGLYKSEFISFIPYLWTLPLSFSIVLLVLLYPYWMGDQDNSQKTICRSTVGFSSAIMCCCCQIFYFPIISTFFFFLIIIILLIMELIISCNSVITEGSQSWAVIT